MTSSNRGTLSAGLLGWSSEDGFPCPSWPSMLLSPGAPRLLLTPRARAGSPQKAHGPARESPRDSNCDLARGNPPSPVVAKSETGSHAPNRLDTVGVPSGARSLATAGHRLRAVLGGRRASAVAQAVARVRKQVFNPSLGCGGRILPAPPCRRVSTPRRRLPCGGSLGGSSLRTAR